MTPGDIGTLVGVALGSPLLLQATTWIVRSLTGREARKRDDAQKAWGYYDRESKLRRKFERHAAELELMLVRAPCVNREDIPAWPANGQTGSNEVEKR